MQSNWRESVKNGTLELPAAISFSTLMTSNRIREQDEAIQPYQVEFLDGERLLRSNWRESVKNGTLNGTPIHDFYR
ncbi:hypothetical protein M3231_14400 [Neobacillus mesonae]|nr:hypothetical protein [Neobacillus mesonae]